MKFIFQKTALVLVMLFPITSMAHHSFSVEFDVNLPLEFTGTVVKVEMINPHSWIHVEVTDDNGDSVTWMVEGGSPNALYRQGITRDSVPIGSELSIFGYQARDKSMSMVGRDMKFSDGRDLFFGGTKTPDSQ